jgi:hypothetical protein
MSSGPVIPERVMVWRQPDGGIRVSVAVPGVEAKHIAELERLGLTRLPDCHVRDLPPRSKRHAWRARADGTLFADTRVPEPPREKTLEERIAALEAKDASLRT